MIWTLRAEAIQDEVLARAAFRARSIATFPALDDLDHDELSDAFIERLLNINLLATRRSAPGDRAELCACALILCTEAVSITELAACGRMLSVYRITSSFMAHG